jgi:CRP/FNR family transcriptional regulator, cyclic AMP receptor protein
MVEHALEAGTGGKYNAMPELRSDIHALAAAINHSPASDALRCQLSPAQWEVLAGYLQFFTIASGQVVIEQAAQDRSLYFIESGSLSVHFQDDKSRVRMAMVSAGSVVGEGAFFSHQPRCATVQASGTSRLWCLTPMRFLELANRHSALALELTIAMGGVMAKRLYNRAKRIAVT